jgi:RNA processing factor Prp31
LQGVFNNRCWSLKEVGAMEKATKENELTAMLTQFMKVIYVDFGINKVSEKIKNWYELSWDEFKKELENHSVKWNDCLIQDWKDYFTKHKSKVQKLLQ